MVEDSTAQAIDGFFIVREGEGADARYAICHRVDSVDGSYQIAGIGKTAAALVDEQKLLAAFVSGGRYDGLKVMSFEPQSGQNVTLIYDDK